MKRLFFVLLALLFFYGTPLAAGNPAEQKVMRGLHFILNRQYSKAHQIFDEIKASYPSHPVGLLGKMAIYQVQMYENFDWRFRSEFEKGAEVNRHVSQEVINNPSSSAKECLAAAIDLGLESYYQATDGSFMRALRLADRAMTAIRQAQKKDPEQKSVFDLWLGLGLYDYWKTTAVLRFRFIPMLQLYMDRRPRGLTRIQRVIDQGIYLSDVATMAKAWVLLEKGDNEEGIQLARKFLKKYPKNILMKNLMGIFLVKEGRYEESFHLFTAVRKEDRGIRVPLYYFGVIHSRQGKLKEALHDFQRFRETAPNDTWLSFALFNEAHILKRLGEKELGGQRLKEAREKLGSLEKTITLFQPPLSDRDEPL